MHARDAAIKALHAATDGLHGGRRLYSDGVKPESASRPSAALNVDMQQRVFYVFW
jgi:hypothetical protein